MVNFIYKSAYTFDDLLHIMEVLRSDAGCPWDREQTHVSIRRNFIEEAYEAVEAIDRADPEHLKEELGDVLLQVVFHAQMEKEAGRFDMDAVADGICKKLILRHPHIFGDVAVRDSAEVLDNWDTIKKREKGQETASDSLMDVAKSLPALLMAEKVQSRAAKAGFDWDTIEGPFAKIREETAELAEAHEKGLNAAEELGDLLFSCVNASRFLRADPEEALKHATEKFIRRFKRIEEWAKLENKSLEKMQIDEMDKLWNRAKDEESVLNQ